MQARRQTLLGALLGAAAALAAAAGPTPPAAGEARAALDGVPYRGLAIAPAAPRRLAAAHRAAAVLDRLAAGRRPVQVVVGVDPGPPAQELAARLRAAALPVTVIPQIGVVSVRAADAAALVARLRAAGPLRFAEENAAPLHLHADQYDAVDAKTGINYSWAYDAVNAGAALRGVIGRPSAPVAVLDTGVDVRHPDLADRLGAQYDALLGGTDVTDGHGHGTMVAGLISAVDGNRIGTKGVAGATTVLPVRVGARSAIGHVDAAKGIVWATDHGARVINMSFGSVELSDVVRSALDYAARKDVLLVASAGNGAQAGNPPNYPASYIGGVAGEWGIGLSVAATDPNGARAPFSQHNGTVSLAAPGATGKPATPGDECAYGVFSTLPTNGGTQWDTSATSGCTTIFGGASNPGGRWAYAQGTSFAAPIVAGVGGLVRHVRPALRADQVARILQTTARGGGTWNENVGYGVIDAGAALAAARTYDTRPPAPSVSITAAPGGFTATVAGTDAANAGEVAATGLTFTLTTSPDGASFYPFLPPQASPIAGTWTVPAGQTLWVRAQVCDTNRNCVEQTAGPFAGPPPRPAVIAPPAPAPPRPPAVTPRRPAVAPSVRALAVQARRARPARLRYLAWDDSGRTREQIRVIGARGRIVARVATRMANSRRSVPQFLLWRVPARAPSSGYRFCVRAFDPSGRASRWSCAPVRVR